MSAKVYAPPEEVGDPPRFNEKLDYDSFSKLEREYESLLKEWVVAHGSGKLCGKEYSYPVGDGYARYFILSSSPLVLIHIGTGDAWNMPDVVARGLRVSDIKKVVERKPIW